MHKTLNFKLEKLKKNISRPLDPLSTIFGHLDRTQIFLQQNVHTHICMFLYDKVSYMPVWLGLRRGVLTCVGWQVTLCDPIWQVTLRSCEMEFH